jgi:hypothetical protein
VISASPSREILPGHPVTLTLDPETGMFAVVEVTIPEGTDSFRIDLFNTTGDTDFWISRNKPAVKRDQALYVANSLLARETFVLTPESVHGAGPGRYFISIFNQMIEEARFDVSIIVTLGTEAPELLKDIVPFPYPRDRFEEALFATVEVIGNAGKGSGCLVSQQGHLLTNFPVLEGRRDKPASPYRRWRPIPPSRTSAGVVSASVVAMKTSGTSPCLRSTEGCRPTSPYSISFLFSPWQRERAFDRTAPRLDRVPWYWRKPGRVFADVHPGSCERDSSRPVSFSLSRRTASSMTALLEARLSNSYSERSAFPRSSGQGSGQIGYSISGYDPKDWLDFFIRKVNEEGMVCLRFGGFFLACVVEELFAPSDVVERLQVPVSCWAYCP